MQEKIIAEEEKYNSLLAENKKLEKAFPQPKPAKGAAAPAEPPRIYEAHCNTLAEKFRQPLDDDINLKESRANLAK